MKDPAVLFYTQDFLVGTMTMSHEHRGMYITLLCLQHQNGKLTENHMLSICGGYVEQVFCKFEKQDDGTYINIRMRDEAIKRSNYTKSRRDNAAKGGRPSKKDKAYAKPHAKPYGSDMLNHIENENENENGVENVDANAAQLTDFKREMLMMKYKLTAKQIDDYTEQVLAYYAGRGIPVKDLYNMIVSWHLKDSKGNPAQPAPQPITYQKLT